MGWTPPAWAADSYAHALPRPRVSPLRGGGCGWRDQYGEPVSVEWEQVVLDAKDPVALGRWWADMLGWIVLNDAPDEFEIRPSVDRMPGLIFEPVSETKRGKNRLHLDLRPDDQQAEVERFLAAGARHADIGQRDVSWVVLAYPEGNEFCILRGRIKD